MTTDVFKFMSLRSSNSIKENDLMYKYINEDYWKIDIATDLSPVKIRKEKRTIGAKDPFIETDSIIGAHSLGSWHK